MIENFEQDETITPRLAYIIDEDGFVIDTTVVYTIDEYVDGNLVTFKHPSNVTFFKMKWNGSEWVEGKTQAEFEEDAFLESLIPTTDEIANAEFELKILNILMEVELI